MGSNSRQELDRILAAQKEKGIARWQVACSLITADFTESQIGVIMGCDGRTIHSMKMRPPREVRNYLRMDAATRSRLFRVIGNIIEED